MAIGPTVLTIDDDPHALMSVRIAARHCRFISATSGAEALRIIADPSSAIDVIVLDLLLPDIQGATLCAMIRQHSASVPIIPMTGHPDALRSVEHLGISTPIIKPAQASEIRRVLEEVLGIAIPTSEAAVTQAVQHTFEFSGVMPPSGERLNGVAMFGERPELIPVRGATWEDLDLNLVEQHIQRAITRRGYDGTDDPLGYLRHHECVVGDGFRPPPTLVGLIAFGIRPDRWLNTEIDIALFSTPYEDPGSIVKRRIFKGTVFTLIEDGLTFLDSLNPQRSRMEGGERVDQYTFSPPVLREVVNNAVLHRDWSIRGAGIQIKMFPDRVEVLSPGGLPQGITVDTIGYTPGVRRNPALAELLRNAGYVERFGIGYKLILRVLDEWGLGAPKLLDLGQFFSVSIPARRFDLPHVGGGGGQSLPQSLKPRDREILKAVDYLGGSATRAQIQDRLRQLMADRASELSRDALDKLYDISERQIQRHLNDLVEAGLLTEEGRTNKRRYHRSTRS